MKKIPILLATAFAIVALAGCSPSPKPEPTIISNPLPVAVEKIAPVEPPAVQPLSAPATDPSAVTQPAPTPITDPAVQPTPNVALDSKPITTPKTDPVVKPVLTAPTTKPKIAPAPALKLVIIESFTFKPNSLTIKKGDSVKWTNKDSAPHTIKSASFNSGNLDTNGSFSFTFKNAGTFAYSCGIHPSMKGTIVVNP